MPNLFAFGIRNLLDSHLRYTGSGTPVFLRVKRFKDENDDGTVPDYIQVGVPFAVTGSDEVGFEDIQVTPQPIIEEVSLANIGLLAGRLNFGSRIFGISHTWVLAQMKSLQIADPLAVFRARNGYQAIGILSDGRLFSIESITPKYAGGEIIRWKVVGNAPERQEAT